VYLRSFLIISDFGGRKFRRLIGHPSIFSCLESIAELTYLHPNRKEKVLLTTTLQELKSEMDEPIGFIATLMPGWNHGPDEPK
jgi:hypothetical protein